MYLHMEDKVMLCHAGHEVPTYIKRGPENSFVASIEKGCHTSASHSTLNLF